MTKSPLIAEDERFERSFAAFTHAQRLKYDAPDPLTVLPRQLQDRLLAAIPFRSGVLFPDTSQAVRPANPISFQPRLVPLTIVTSLAEPIKSVELREVLRGDRKETPRLIKHPGLDVFTVVEGGTTWLAAQMLGMEVLLVQVARPRKVVPVTPADGPIFPMDDLVGLAQQLTKFHIYRIPPALERLAALARRTTRDIFSTVIDGREHTDEEEARDRAARLTIQRIDLLHELEEAEIMMGTRVSMARAKAEGNPAVRKLKRLEDSADRIFLNVQQRFMELREERDAALLEAKALAEKELAFFPSVWVSNPFILWGESNKPLTIEELATGRVVKR